MSDSDQTPSILADRQFQFRLEEYKSLRGEIDTRIKESFALVIYCVTAISAIYGSFVAAKLSDKTVNLDLLHRVLEAAIIFPVFGLIKSKEAWDITLRIASHLRDFEMSLGLEGWEHRAEDHRNELNKTLWAQITKPPYVPFWVMLIAITIIVRLSV
jgi:hypothetical protein